MAIVNDVVTRFSFKGSLSKLSKYNSLLSTSIKSIQKATLGLLGFGTAFVLFTNKIAKSNESLIQLSRSTGISIKRIQELGFAASQTGSSSDALRATISSLSNTIGSAAQRGNEDFLRLGISVRTATGQIKTADQVLLEISERFRRFNLSLSERQSFASRLGIDRNLVRLLGKTSKELKELFNTADRFGVLSTKDAEALSKYNDSLNALKFGFRAIANQIAVGFAPELTRLTDKLSSFLIKNKEFIKDLTVSFVTLGIDILGAIRDLIKGFIDLGVQFGLTKGQALGLGVALAIAFGPLGVINTTIGLIVLGIQDIITGLTGGQSVILDFFQRIADGLKKIFNQIRNEIGSIFSGTLIGSAFGTGNRLLKSGFNVGLESTIKGLNALDKSRDSPIFKALNRTGGFSIEAAKDFLPGFDAFSRAISGAANLFGSFTGVGGLEGKSFNTGALRNTQNITINIQSNDPIEVGRVV